MDSRVGLSQPEWVRRVMASVWLRLFAQFREGMSDEEARDLNDALDVVRQAQLVLLEESEERRAERFYG
jgi:hypothetical protein